MKQHYAPALNRCRKKETLLQINWRAGAVCCPRHTVHYTPFLRRREVAFAGEVQYNKKVKIGRKEGTQRAGTKREKSPGRWLDGPARL